MKFVDGLSERFRALRRRSPMVDHLSRAIVRYYDADFGRFGAAGGYYGFFAFFAMIVVTFVIFGKLFRNNLDVVSRVQTYLQTNLPQLHAAEIFQGSQEIGLLAVVGLVVAGVSWVESLRSSQRAIWGLQENPGNPVIRWLVDLAVLVGLGILLLISIGIFSGVQEFLFWLTGNVSQSPLRVALRGTSTISSGLVDVVLGAALLAGVPRLRMSLRRLLPSALLFAVGLGLLKTVGKWYIVRTERNPAYQLVAGTVAVMLFMYLLHQVLLFAAALAATDTHGRVVDLAGGKVPRDLATLALAAGHAAEHADDAALAAERAALAAVDAVQAQAKLDPNARKDG